MIRRMDMRDVQTDGKRSLKRVQRTRELREARRAKRLLQGTR